MTPYMNHGRWVIDCSSLNCGGAMRVLPWQAIAVCDCGDRDFCQHGNPCATIVQLDWPVDRMAIESVMQFRPLLNRNWYPWETLEGLGEENTAHGLDRS